MQTANVIMLQMLSSRMTNFFVNFFHCKNVPMVPFCCYVKVLQLYIARPLCWFFSTTTAKQESQPKYNQPNQTCFDVVERLNESIE